MEEGSPCNSWVVFLPEGLRWPSTRSSLELNRNSKTSGLESVLWLVTIYAVTDVFLVLRLSLHI